MEQTIPVVDLGAFRGDDENERAAFVRTFGDALRDFGFVAVEGYGVDDAVFENAYDAFATFFALPEVEKRRSEILETGRRRGYTSFGVEHAKDHPTPDLKEFFHVGREVADGPLAGKVTPNVWPEEPATLRECAMRLFEALDRIAFDLLDAVGIYLDAPARHFADMARDGNTLLRVIHYPVCDGFDAPGAMRAAPHEDINLMTILPPAKESGLELLARDGTWLPIHAVPGQLIVDSGDMMMRVTGDRIPATTHRVVNPVGTPTPRYSMPFFVHPHVDAILEVLPSCVPAGERPKYAPIGAEAFLQQRLEEIGVA